MSKSNKKPLAKGSKGYAVTGDKSIKESIDLFKCPICERSMSFDRYNSIACFNKHCFDIARSGYVNLLLKPSKDKYDKELFESRNIVYKMGLFDPLIESIVSLIRDYFSNRDIDKRILDAGCGEGYHLSQVVERLQKNQGSYFQGVGIDISKAGIQAASKCYKGITWCVADLAKLPFKDRSFDVVLNILSPSNYGEFNRVVTKEGLLIKVVPNSGYLKELRNALYQGTSKQWYSNDRVIEHFSKNFKIIDTQVVQHSISLSSEGLSHLIKMTPLSWGVTEEAIRKVLGNLLENITADFTIIVGKKRI